MSKQPKTLSFNIAFGKGGIEPEGTKQTLLIRVRDEIATYRFTNASTTKKFTASQNKDGVKSQYVERIQTCICSYPNMKQEEIEKHIISRLSELKEGKKNV